MTLTNGTRVSEAGPLRRFELIARHKQFLWVEAVNGNYQGELLTFRAVDLREIREDEK